MNSGIRLKVVFITQYLGIIVAIPQNSGNLWDYFPGGGVNSSMTVTMIHPFSVSFQKKWAKEIAFFSLPFSSENNRFPSKWILTGDKNNNV